MINKNFVIHKKNNLRYIANIIDKMQGRIQKISLPPMILWQFRLVQKMFHIVLGVKKSGNQQLFNRLYNIFKKTNSPRTKLDYILDLGINNNPKPCQNQTNSRFPNFLNYGLLIFKNSILYV